MFTQKPPPLKVDYRRELDGLRALAILPVILFHAGFNTFSGGFIGVDIFFVISGYLITSIILADLEQGKFSIIDFYDRRARRILPALFFVILICLPFAWFWLSPADMRIFSESLIYVPTFISNIFFYKQGGYFETAAELQPLLHTWTLAVEEQYYLLFPIFLILTYRFAKGLTLASLSFIFLSSIFYAEYKIGLKPEAAFFLLPSRLWELLIGAFIAFHFLNNKWQPSKLLCETGGATGLLLIVYAVFVFDKQTPFPSLFTLIPTFGTALIILFASQHTTVGKLLGNKFLVGIGLISYSTYLWHQPLYAFLRHRNLGEPSQLLFGLLAILSIFLAYFSWRYIEKPFRDKQKFSRKQIFTYSVLGSTFFIAFGLVGHFTKGTYERDFPTAVNLIQATVSDISKNNKCWDLIKKTKSLENLCVLGNATANKTFTLVGDSHAGAIAKQLGIAASNLDLSGYDYTLNSCPPLYGGSRKKQGESQLACNTLRNDLFNKIEQKQLPNTLILLSRWTKEIEGASFNNKEGGVEIGVRERSLWHAPDYERLGDVAALKKNYADSVMRMLNAGHKVILIYPVPEAGWNVPNHMYRLHLNNGVITKADASTSHAVFIERNKRSYEALDDIGYHPNLVRIKPENFFCNTYVPSRCVTQIEGKPLYFDDDHLSRFGAELIVPEIIKHLSN